MKDVYDTHHKNHLGRAWIKHEKNFPKQRLGLTKQDIHNKSVLEIGCGGGNYLRYYEKFKPKLLIGIDPSITAVNKSNQTTKMAVAFKASVFDMPFIKYKFDVIYSTGVLHHTGDTKKAFMTLIPYLKKGGIISICVYGKRPNKFTLDLWRKITLKLPHIITYFLSLCLVPFSYLFKYVKPLAILTGWIPVIVLEGKQTLKHFEYIWSNIYDDFTVPHLQNHDVTEVYSWFKEAGLTVTDILYPEVSIKGKK